MRARQAAPLVVRFVVALRQGLEPCEPGLPGRLLDEQSLEKCLEVRVNQLPLRAGRHVVEMPADDPAEVGGGVGAGTAADDAGVRLLVEAGDREQIAVRRLRAEEPHRRHRPVQ